MADHSSKRLRRLKANNRIQHWSFRYKVVSIQSRFDTSRFDTNSGSEIPQKFPSLQVKFAIEQENHFGRIFFVL